MAILSNALIASLLISLLTFHLVQADDEMMNGGGIGSGGISRSLLQKIDCGGACKERCKLSSRQNLCKRACGTCCQRCNCVPPGTSGNQDACPCYATLTTHGGRKKCP
ncbi:Snakin-2 like [Actinidia chinensis var. chinensis]|uniref:Snakin-2 like n=1 Tax=Actinidia chinensis var. chinensis TaxID=1590841 RepID=A0A2R6RMJ7_ACTCC|nr:Snakin-2 like [Actinidia chinensis var. chinensis]